MAQHQYRPNRSRPSESSPRKQTVPAGTPNNELPDDSLEVLIKFVTPSAELARAWAEALGIPASGAEKDFIHKSRDEHIEKRHEGQMVEAEMSAVRTGRADSGIAAFEGGSPNATIDKLVRDLLSSGFLPVEGWRQQRPQRFRNYKEVEEYRDEVDKLVAEERLSKEAGTKRKSEAQVGAIKPNVFQHTVIVKLSRRHGESPDRELGDKLQAFVNDRVWGMIHVWIRNPTQVGTINVCGGVQVQYKAYRVLRFSEERKYSCKLVNPPPPLAPFV